MSGGKKGFFGRLVEGLTKTRNSIVAGIDSIFSGFSAIDDDFYEEIEETLIMGDLGIQTTMAIILSACTPPFKIFIIGIGSFFAFTPPR